MHVIELEDPARAHSLGIEEAPDDSLLPRKLPFSKWPSKINFYTEATAVAAPYFSRHWRRPLVNAQTMSGLINEHHQLTWYPSWLYIAGVFHISTP